MKTTSGKWTVESLVELLKLGHDTEISKLQKSLTSKELPLFLQDYLNAQNQVKVIGKALAKKSF